MIRLYGGVQRVLKLSIGKPSPILAIQLILLYVTILIVAVKLLGLTPFSIATLANTTTPANNQMTGFSDWSTTDIRTVYSTTMYSEMPCPTHLFLNIIEISRLRGLLTTLTGPYADALWPSISEVFKNIESFSPEDWTEPYTVPKKPEMTLIARVYKQATTLYGVLSLPPPPMLNYDLETSQPSKAAAYLQLKAATRNRLFQLVTEAMETLRPNLSLCWPLAVLGVALADGEPSERTFVEKSLRKISRSPQTYYGPTMSLVKLMSFWESGKSGWEDCYNEPCSVIA